MIKFVFGFVKTKRYHLKLSRRALTTIPPLDRFECTECPWLGSAHMSKELRELLGRAHETAEGSAKSSWPWPHAALPAALHLNGLRLRSPLPADFGQCIPPGMPGLAAFAAVTELSLDHNELTELPPLHMPCLAVLSLHDNDLRVLPQLRHLARLASLRLDRNARLGALPSLPGSLRVLHLGGCSSLPGTYDDPASLPATVLELHDVLDDCMLPDDSMMGIFFGTPLPPPPSPAVASSDIHDDATSVFEYKDPS